MWVPPAELESLRDRHVAALVYLRTTRAELGTLKNERDAIAEKASVAAARVRDTTHEAMQAGEAAVELDVLMADLESARTAHDTTQERRNKVMWQRELEQCEMEARRLRDELVAAGDLESKVVAAFEHLANLGVELFARAIEWATKEEDKHIPVARSTPTTLAKVKKELEEVKGNVEKAKDEAKILHVAVASLCVDLEKEKAELAAVGRKERRSSSPSILSLEEEPSRRDHRARRGARKSEGQRRGE
ncbi:hypothetical protein ZWY2020_057149 [Hordeum vulgare]|nr:hypothetical protein ZWY2020_057149 [Hordeum vulgare]